MGGGHLNVAWRQVIANELEEIMTAAPLTDIAAQEHINDLRREAERHRLAAEVATPRPVRFSIPRLFARRIARPVAA